MQSHHTSKAYSSHTGFWESTLILGNCICQTTVGFHKPAFMTGLIEESNSRAN